VEMIFSEDSFIPGDIQEMIYEFIPIEDLPYIYKKFGNDQWLIRFCDDLEDLSLVSLYRIMNDVTLPEFIRVRRNNKAMRIEVPEIRDRFNNLRSKHITQSIDSGVTDDVDELAREIIIRDDVKEWHRLTEDLPEISMKDCHTCFRFTLECNAMKIWKYRVYQSIHCRYGLNISGPGTIATSTIPSMLMLLEKLDFIPHEDYCSITSNKHLMIHSGVTERLDHQVILNMYVITMIESLQIYSTCYQYIKETKTSNNIRLMIQQFKSNHHFTKHREYYMSVCTKNIQSYGLSLFKELTK